MSKTKLNFSTYPQSYYTGAQVRVYIGSIWVDDIATIQYKTSHSKTPLYGYCDHKFRAVAKGLLSVQGSFTIAFKDTGYLYKIIKLLQDDTIKDNVKKTSGAGEFMSYIASGLTVEAALDEISDNYDLKLFKEAASVMENTIWGSNENNKYLNRNRRIPRSDELDLNKYTESDYKDDNIDVQGFNILMTFGNYKNGIDSVEHTMVAINNVHITGESMIVTPAGEPIGLTYNFFARGINENVNGAWPIQDIETADDARNDNEKTEEVSKAVVEKAIKEAAPANKLVNKKDLKAGSVKNAKSPIAKQKVITVAQPVDKVRGAMAQPAKTKEQIAGGTSTQSIQPVNNVTGAASIENVSTSMYQAQLDATLIKPTDKISAINKTEPGVQYDITPEFDYNTSPDNSLILYQRPDMLLPKQPNDNPIDYTAVPDYKSPLLNEPNMLLNNQPAKSKQPDIQNVKPQRQTVTTQTQVTPEKVEADSKKAVEIYTKYNDGSLFSNTETPSDISTKHNILQLEKQTEILGQLNMKSLPIYIQSAVKQLGVKEIEGSAYNKQISKYHDTIFPTKRYKEDIAWCASFVNTMLKENNINTSKSGLASSFIKYGTQATNKVGAITVVKSAASNTGYHVGFCVGESADGKNIYLLGGNQSINDTIDGVTIKMVPKDSVVSYRKPK